MSAHLTEGPAEVAAEAAALGEEARRIPPSEARGLRSLLSDSLLYGIGSAALAIGLFVATPFIARELGPVGFGTIEVLATIAAAAAVLAMVGLDGAAARSYFDYGPHELRQRRTVLRTAMLGVLASSTALAVALVALAVVFVQTLSTEPETSTVVAAIIAFSVLPLTNGQTIARVAFLLDRRRAKFLTGGLLYAGVGGTLAVLLVLGGAGPSGYFVGLGVGALASLLFALVFGGFMTRQAAVDRSELFVMLRYGLPLVPASLAVWAVFAIDRSLIASIRGLFDAGHYGLASKVAAPLMMAVSAFALAWGPFIMSQPEGRRLRLRARALTAVTAAAGTGFVLLVLFARPLVDLLGGHEFERSSRAVPGIALGWLWWAIASVLATEFAVNRRTRVIGAATGVSAAINILLNLILIPPFGFVGAAWATAASFALLALCYWFWERRTIRVRYRWGRLALIALVIGGATPALLIDETTTGWIARGLIAAAVFVVLAFVAATDRDSRRQHPAAQPALDG